jgi:hypothetical protein
MKAIKAHREITASSEFRELERLRADARHNEAAALYHAAEVERKKWLSALADLRADKESEIARLRERLAELQSRFGEGE